MSWTGQPTRLPGSVKKAIFALLLAVPGCAEGIPPLEPISHESTHTLRVLYLDDHRLPSPSPREREKLYRKIEILLKTWYSFDVEVREVAVGNLLERFEASSDIFQTESARSYLDRAAIDLGGFGVKDLILQTIRKDLKHRDEKLIRRYVNLPKGASKRDAESAVYSIFEDRLTRLRKTKVGEDGAETLHNRRWAITQSFPHWEVFLENLKEADFVLTNSIIAGPDAGMPLYVAVRGGITNGFITNSLHNPFQAVGVVGMYPFLADSDFFNKERGRLRGKMDVLATFWMHELGHFFLRMKEHYGEAGCVHVAPEGLRVYEWHKAIRKSSNKCRYLPEERLTIF